RRAAAEHDQPDRGRIRARLLHRDPRCSRARVPRARRLVEGELGRRALLGDRQLERAAGRVVVVRLPGPRDRRHRARAHARARRHRRGLEPEAAGGAREMISVVEPVASARTTTSRSEALVDLRGLTVDYGRVRAVDGIDLTISAGEVVGLAGESGCGKTTVANALMQILRPPARIVGGSILFEGQDLLALKREQLRRYRWR